MMASTSRNSGLVCASLGDISPYLPVTREWPFPISTFIRFSSLTSMNLKDLMKPILNLQAKKSKSGTCAEKHACLAPISSFKVAAAQHHVKETTFAWLRTRGKNCKNLNMQILKSYSNCSIGKGHRNEFQSSPEL